MLPSYKLFPGAWTLLRKPFLPRISRETAAWKVIGRRPAQGISETVGRQKWAGQSDPAPARRRLVMFDSMLPLARHVRT